QPIGDFRRVARGREVAGIVPSTVHDDSPVPMDAGAVPVAYAVNSGDLHTASLAVEEVDGFPDAASPGVIGNPKRTCHRVAGLDDIRARLPDLRKIERLVWAQIGLRAVDWFGEDYLTGLLANQFELTSRQIARNGGLGRAGRVAAVAERDLAGRYIPALGMVRLNPLQLKLVEVKDSTVFRIGQHLGLGILQVERGDLVPGDGCDLPDHMVPGVVIQKHGLMFAFVLPVWNLLLSVVVHRHSEGDEPGADNVGIDPHRDPVIGAPVFAGKRAGRTKPALTRTPGAGSGVWRGGNGAEPQRMAALLGPDVRQRHLSLTSEGPVGEILHAVQQTRSQHFLAQPAIVCPVFVPRLHRHGRGFLCREFRPGGQERENRCKKKAGYSIHTDSPKAA